MPPIRRSVLVAAVIAVLLVAVGMWLVVAGWPMETPAQVAMLDLAQLPMSAAVLVAIVEMTYERRLWLRRPRGFAAVFAPGAVLLLGGVVMLLVAFGRPARHLVGPAQLLIWTGLGIAFLYLAVDSVRRELRFARTESEHLDEDEQDLDDRWLTDDDEDDDADVPDQTGGDHPLGSYGSYQAPRLLDDPSPEPEARGL